MSQALLTLTKLNKNERYDHLSIFDHPIPTKSSEENQMMS